MTSRMFVDRGKQIEEWKGTYNEGGEDNQLDIVKQKERKERDVLR